LADPTGDSLQHRCWRHIGEEMTGIRRGDIVASARGDDKYGVSMFDRDQTRGQGGN
jgi:hypothetical protein